jgi:hypothetical protein
MVVLAWILVQAAVPDLDAALRQGNARPRPLADADLVARLSTDLLGEALPEADREAYAADPGADKRARLVDLLLADERYGRHWAARYRRLWLGEAEGVRFTGIPGWPPERYGELAKMMEQTLASMLNRDKSWFGIVSGFLGARGTPEGDPWLAYPLSFRGHESPELAFASAMPRHFLGIRFDCARCHDHPYQEWRVEDFYGLAAYEAAREVRWKNGRLEIVERDSPSISLPPDGRPPRRVGPRFFLTGSSSSDDALSHLASVFPSQPQAARAAVNQVAAWLFGAGFTTPADAMDPRRKSPRVCGAGPAGEGAPRFQGLAQIHRPPDLSHGRVRGEGGGAGLPDRSPEAGAGPWSCAPGEPAAGPPPGSRGVGATSAEGAR